MRRRSKLITLSSMKTCRTPSEPWKTKSHHSQGRAAEPHIPPYIHTQCPFPLSYCCLIHSTAFCSSCGVIDALVFLRCLKIPLFVCVCVCVCVCVHLCICVYVHMCNLYDLLQSLCSAPVLYILQIIISIDVIK